MNIAIKVTDKDLVNWQQILFYSVAIFTAQAIYNKTIKYLIQ